MRSKEGWYSFAIENARSSHFVINDNMGNQTADLSTEKDVWIDDLGEFHDAPPKVKKKPAKPMKKAKPLSSPQLSGKDFREETIYFLMTARFYDGDPSNNFFCRDRIEFDSAGEAVDPHWRGDFKGLIERLDYIKDLGFTAIWITPPIENRSGLDYHGYHGYDWNKIDPRLESPDATYADLIREVHDRGMKIVQDVVINHSGQFGVRGKVHIDHLLIKYYVPQGKEHGEENNGPYKGNLGNYQSK